MRLNALIPSVARVKVLTLLLLGGEGRYYVREIERRTAFCQEFACYKVVHVVQTLKN
jgi:hypothetical protein